MIRSSRLLIVGGTAAVKAQVHAGGRGKAGGIKLVSSAEEAERAAASLLGASLVTFQTGPEGIPVRSVLVEEALDVERAQLPALKEFLNERIGVSMAVGRAIPTLNVDASIRLGGATNELIAAIQQIAPFGAGNPEPRFMLPSVRVVKADVVGKGHVRCILSDAAIGEGKSRLKAIAFRAVGEPLGDALLESGGLPLHLAGKIRLDTWQGRDGVQFLIDDAAQI